MTNQEFSEYVLSQVPVDHSFRPVAHYDPDGDCIEFVAAPDSYHAERIDTLVTVYRSQETNEIIGSLIKGVSKFFRDVLQRAPGFKIEVRDGRMKLTHLFTARLWAEEISPTDLPCIVYQKLREVAEQSGAEVEMGDLVLV